MSTVAAMEALRGEPYQVILNTLRQQTVIAVGKIQGSQLKLLQSFIGATGLRNRLSNATPEQAAAAASVAEAIQPAYLAREDSYSINLADPKVAQLLDDAVAAGILNASEKAYLVQLATFQKQLYPNITLHDIVAHFEPTLVDVGEGVVVDNVTSNRLQLRTTVAMPEPTMVRIEMSESEDGIDWTEFKRVNHFYNVHQPDFYFAAIPNNGLQRRFRVCGETYRLTGTVKAV